MFGRIQYVAHNLVTMLGLAYRIGAVEHCWQVVYCNATPFRKLITKLLQF